MPVKKRKPMSKEQTITSLAEETGIAKKDCAAVYDALGTIIDREIRNGPGQFKLLNLLKITTKDVPAREAQYGVPNPFKPGETRDIAAKPASKKVKVTPLKALKEMA